MLRDNLVGLIEPMLGSAGAYPLALCTEPKQSSDDRPPCLENPRPEGAESTLTENAPSPFHAEPKQTLRMVRGRFDSSFLASSRIKLSKLNDAKEKTDQHVHVISHVYVPGTR